MKNVMTIISAIAFLTMALPTGTMAQGGHKEGGAKCNPAPAVTPETMQKFKKETRGLQEQLIDKQAALKKEFLKDNPDLDSVAVIKKAIIDIERDMQKVARKLGMKMPCHMSGGCVCGGGMGMGGGMGGCGGEMHHGGEMHGK